MAFSLFFTVTGIVVVIVIISFTISYCIDPNILQRDDENEEE